MGVTRPPHRSSRTARDGPFVGGLIGERRAPWRRFLLVAVLIAGTVYTVSRVAGSSDDKETDSAPITDVATTIDPDDDTATTDATATSAATVTTMPVAPASNVEEVEEVAGAPEGLTGDRDAPVFPGAIADVGNGYRLQVLSVVPDATDFVVGANSSNTPPPEGRRYTLVYVAFAYYGVDEPQPGILTRISAVGASAVQLDASCGVVPEALDLLTDLFAGGILAGNVCFETTPDDIASLQVYAAGALSGPEVFLDASESPFVVQAMTPRFGPQPGAASAEGRTSPVPLGTPTDLGAGWTITVTSAATDITDAVIAENQFNDPPPDGIRFVGVPLTLKYDGETTANAIDVSIGAIGHSNVAPTTSCGVVPDPLDRLTDLFAGGEISGTECFAVTVDDIDSLVLHASSGGTTDHAYLALR